MELDSPGLNRHDSIHDLLSFVVGLAVEHLIKNRSQCPNVALLRIHVLGVGLWRHIGRRPHVVEHFWLGKVALNLAVPEI